MLAFGLLVVAAGVVCTALAFVLEEPGSNKFWGWMGGGWDAPLVDSGPRRLLEQLPATHRRTRLDVLTSLDLA